MLKLAHSEKVELAKVFLMIFGVFVLGFTVSAILTNFPEFMIIAGGLVMLSVSGWASFTLFKDSRRLK